jgi:hypothetical protein
MMAKEPLTIPLDPTSELAQVLAAVGTPVVLESNGVRYTVEREDIFARYDVETVLRGLRQSRGALRGVDTAALLADLAEQRRQDSTRRPC